MKITHLTTLKHKLQWLVLLAVLLGVSQGMWAWSDPSRALFGIKIYKSETSTDYRYFCYKYIGSGSFTCTGYPGGNYTGGYSSTDLGILNNNQHFYIKSEVWVNNQNQGYSAGAWYYKIDNGTESSKTYSKQGNYNGWCDGHYWDRYDSGELDLTNSGLTAGEHKLKVKFKAPWNGTLQYPSSSTYYEATFTVPGISVQPSTSGQSLCKNGSATALSVTAVGSSPSYQWQSATTSGGTYSNISGANSSSYTPPTGTVGTKYYRCKVTISGTTYTSNASGAIVVNDNPSLESVSGPTQLVVSTNPAGTYTTQSIASATYTWSTTLTSSSGLNSSTSNSVTAYTGSTTQSGKKVSVYATKNGCKSNTVELTGISVVASCTTVTSTSVGGAATMSLSNGASEAITSSTTYVGTISPTGAGDTYLWSVSPSPFSGSTTIGTSTATSTTIQFRREGEYAVKFAAGCGSASVESSAYTVNVYPGNLYVAGPLVNNSWAVTPASQTMSKTGSGTSSVYTYEWTAPSDFVAGSSSVEGGEFTVQSVTNMSLPNYILSAYCPADPSTYTNIYRVTNTANHNLRCTFAVSSGDKLKLRVAYNGTTGSPKAPYYTFTLNKVPVPTTGDVTDITWTQAKLWGTYPKASEYEEVTSRGFYYGTTSSPGTKVLNGTQYAGSIAKTITGLTPGTTYYYKAFVVSGGIEYYGSVESFTTTACSNPTVSTQPSTTAREYCKDEASPASLTVVATGGVNEYTYQWKQCATSGGTYTNVSAGSGGTTATYTPSTATAGGLYYKCVVTNSGICTSNSVTSNASGKYTIDAASVGGSISGGSTSVCPGSTKNLTLGSYTGSIQWHSSSTSGFTPSSTTAISGATSATYAAPISTAGTKYYKAVVTNGVCASATSSQSYLTVKRSAVAGDYTLTNNAQTYNGSARAVTVTPASGAGAATVYYTGTGSTTYAKSTTAPTNAGSYSITIDAAAGDDYCAATNLSLGTDSIKKATQSTLTISNTITSLVYCDDASVTLTTSGGSGGGAVTYAVTSGSGSVDGDVLSPSARGSVTVVADKAASANYKGIKSAAKTFNFNVDAPTVYTLSNVGGATTICGDPSTGAGSGTLRLANSQTGYNYQLYSNGSPVEGYAAKAGTTGSSIDFPVTSSGTYTVYAYYGTNSSNCATQMDGEITLTISTQPKLVRSAASVTEYMPVTITSVSTDIAEWKIVDGSGNDVSSSTAYLFDQTYDAITFKGASTDASTPKTYTIKATTAGGCSETTTVTVNPDTESCS